MTAAVESLARLRDAVGSARSEGLPAPGLAQRLDVLHREGRDAFDAQGLPTRRLENWKGTSLAPLEALDFVRLGPAAASSPGVFEQDAETEADVCLVDGVVVSASAARANLPEGVRILSLLEAATEDAAIVEAHLGSLADGKRESLVALNDALFQDVAIVLIDRNADCDRPIRIAHRTTRDTTGATAAFPRLLVVAATGSRATVAFDAQSEKGAVGLTSLVAEFVLADDARIDAVFLQGEGSERIHVSQIHSKVGRDAAFDSHAITLGDGLLRSELAVRLTEPGATTKMNGFFLGRNQAHIDHFTTVDHEAPHCSSDEEYRGVLADASAGVFRGRVIVRPDAQKTDARQSNPNLLLSDRATIDTKPQLEIYADDVKASHGSTIGQLDPDALFFLRARGIDEKLARLVLTRAFAQTILDGLKDDDLRESVGSQLESALESLEASAPNERA